MKLVGRIFVALLLVAFMLPLSNSSVFASKQLYKATLRTTNEIHEVVGSSARGSMVLGYNMDGSMRFTLSVRSLSGPATGAHLHGPATAEQSTGVLFTLCGGGPSPKIFATCDTSADGTLLISGNITSSFLAQYDLLPVDFVNMLDNELVYVNVHTTLNPSGETRGQLIGQ